MSVRTRRTLVQLLVAVLIASVAVILFSSTDAGACPYPPGHPDFPRNSECESTTTTVPDETTTTVPETTTVPDDPTTTTVPSTSTSEPEREELPRTGSGVGWLAAMGAALVSAGALAVARARKEDNA